MASIVGRYMLGEVIGRGAFGHVFTGTDISTGDAVAVKVESVGAKYLQLKHESKIYWMLTPALGVPSIRAFGTQLGFNYIVLDRLGPSLQSTFDSCNHIFTFETTLFLARQMLQRIQYLHSRCVIHRDIKPDNFVLGIEDRRNEVNIIDFGLAKRFCDSEGHIPHRVGKKLVGTVQFASVNNHQGHEQSRRDDLESLAYVLCYFFLGNLPWQNPEGTTRQQRDVCVLKQKLEFRAEMTLYGFPKELQAFLEYTYGLGFDEDPNYFYMHKLLTNLYDRL